MIELLWNAPTSESSMARTIEVLDLRPGQTVLDVGCGCGEVLIRLNERFKIVGIGIDVSAEHINEAKRRANRRVADSTIQFQVADAQCHKFDPQFVDLGICMGATHAFGEGKDSYRNALKKLSQFVVPGGLLLIAEGYMKQPASLEYRELLGEVIPDEMTHAANVAEGINQGLVPLAAWTSTVDEWDDFEWTYQRNVERHAAERPNDSDAIAKVARRREWMEAYLRWGRDTLGYGTYLFRKPNQ